MMDYIDIYCERVEYGFWAEPLNALTNIAFFIAAFVALRQARREKALDLPVLALIVLMFAIGTGSFLFHTLATGWAMAADSLPILLFQIGFLLLYAMRVMEASRAGIVVLLGLYMLFTVICGAVPGAYTNGSLGYIPALVFLFGLGVYHRIYYKPDSFVLLTASGVFFVSLTLRTFDGLLCPLIPAGTHFIWHCLNAVVLYLCMRALIASHPLPWNLHKNNSPDQE